VSATGLRLWEGSTTIFGVGSWHALLLTLRFLREMLLREQQRRAVFHGPDGGRALSVEGLFCLDAVA
jgi:hypothetical protein